MFSSVVSPSNRRATYLARLLEGDTTLLNMRLRQYSEDTAPLVPGCTCLACNGVADGDVSHFAAGTPAGAAAREVLHPGHTRAYIHHLVNAGELLSKVLLQAHNVTHYAGFFAAIRAAIQAGKLKEYTAWLLAVNHFA
ncbi:MAG: hypothetical protein EOO41_05820 [Methanobacteriota archaeon]|nr:MAG: hypothetical protein EOO41_05820 [Euryarchaeota archaeon]